MSDLRTGVEKLVDDEPDVFGRERAQRELWQRDANAKLRRRVAGLELHRGDLERLLALLCDRAGAALGMTSAEVLAAVVAIDEERELAIRELLGTVHAEHRRRAA